MLAAAIIVLRESFEAALLIGIIAAATRSIAGRGRWISGGIAAGVAGACVVAALTGRIATLFDGAGQELFALVYHGAAARRRRAFVSATDLNAESGLWAPAR